MNDTNMPKMEEETVAVPKEDYELAFYKGFPRGDVRDLAKNILERMSGYTTFIISKWRLSDCFDDDCFGRPREFQASLDYLVERGELVEITLTNQDKKIDSGPNEHYGNKFYILRENWGPLASA